MMNNPLNYIDPIGLDTIKPKRMQPIKPMDDVITDDGRVVKSAVGEVVVAATRPVHDSSGDIIYEDGTVKNFQYSTGDGKYAVFTDRKTGAKTYFQE